MKVLILGLDGLDGVLVERWGIKEYMQLYHGSHDVTVAVKPGEPLYTPLIWAAFLLGKPAYHYGFTFSRIDMEKQKAAYGILSPLYVIRLKLFGRRKLGIRRLLAKLGIYNVKKAVEKAYEIEVLPKEAMGDVLTEVAKGLGFKVWVKEFPGLGDPKYAEVRVTFSHYLDLPLKDRLRKLDEIYEYSINMLRESVNALRDHDLVLYYTALPDEANHMLYRPRNLKLMTLLATYYKKLAKQISSFTSGLTNTAVLIVSDHGYDPSKHEHSEVGFWGLNIKPPYTPRTILDFKELILMLLKQ